MFCRGASSTNTFNSSSVIANCFSILTLNFWGTLLSEYPLLAGLIKPRDTFDQSNANQNTLFSFNFRGLVNSRFKKIHELKVAEHSF